MQQATTQAAPDLRGLALDLGTGIAVAVACLVGYAVLDLGPACSTIWHDDYALGAGATAICSGDVPLQATFLTYVVVGLAAVSALVRGSGRTARPWRLRALAVALPMLAFVVLRGISLVP